MYVGKKGGVKWGRIRGASQEWEVWRWDGGAGCSRGNQVEDSVISDI